MQALEAAHAPDPEKKSPKLQWWHENLSLWMLANPDKTMKDAAKFFDVTPQCLYLIKNSDSFQVYYRDRSNELAEKTLDKISDIYTKTGAMTEAALDAINDRLQSNSSVMDIDTLHKIADSGLRRLGYGAPTAPPGPSVAVNVGVVVDRGVLEGARARLTERFSGSPATVELAAPPGSPSATLEPPGDPPHDGGL